MRTMMKKSGAIAVLTAALLVMAVLVTTGCQEPEVAAGPAKGTVRIIFGDDSGARTILPIAPAFSIYTLAFVCTSNSSFTENITVTPTTAGIGSFPSTTLNPGDYTLTVTGYDDADPTPLAVARASTTATIGGITIDPDTNEITDGFSIGSGDTLTITVNTKPYAFGTGTGTFSYTVTLGGLVFSDLKTGSIALAPYAGGTGTSQNLTLATTTSSFNNVNSGMYWVDFTIDTEISGGIKYRDLVHIYQNMTSNLTRSFSNAHLYYVPPALPGNGSGDITYIHAVDGNFGATLALIEVSENGNTIPAGAGLSEGNPIVLSKDDDDAPTGVRITLTNPILNTLASYGWFYNGSTQMSVNGPLDVDIDTPYFSSTGLRSITLRVTTHAENATVTPPQVIPPVRGTFSLVIWVEVVE